MVSIMDTRALPAAGMVYRSGHYTRQEFIDRCHVDPLMFPRYFRVNKHGLVIVKTTFRAECDNHFNRVQHNWSRLGLGRAGRMSAC